MRSGDVVCPSVCDRLAQQTHNELVIGYRLSSLYSHNNNCNGHIVIQLHNSHAFVRAWKPDTLFFAQ